jgi:hypothetical protein
MNKRKKYEIHFDVEGLVLQFRLLTIGEYEYYTELYNSKKVHPYFIFEEIFNVCDLNSSTKYDNKLPAGCFVTAGETVYILSGDGNKKEKLLFDIAAVRKRNPLDSMYSHMRAVIMMAFHSYKLNDIYDLTRDEFIELFVIAENFLTKTNPNFVRLDLHQIYEEQIEGKTKEPVVEKKVYQNENAELEKSLGYWEIENAKKLYEEEQKKIAENKANLERIDRMRKQK